MTDNNTQSTPKNDKELFDAMSEAVSKGDQAEISRLMAVEVVQEQPEPDATDEEAKPDESADETADEKGEASPGDDEAPEPSEKSSPPEAAKDAASATAKTEGLSPEQLQLLIAKVHKLESDAGRVGHLQSKIVQLERQLKETKASAKPAEPQESEEQRKFRERIKALKEIDPDQAETLELLEKMSARKETPAPKTDFDDVDPEREELIKAVQIVESVHPDALPIFEHASWKQWKSQLSADKREWAESHEPGKVIVALNAFKQDMALLQQQQNQPDAKGGDPASKPDAGNDAVKTARERKLEDGGASRNTPIKNKGVVDESALFDEYYTKIQKEAGIK